MTWQDHFSLRKFDKMEGHGNFLFILYERITCLTTLCLLSKKYSDLWATHHLSTFAPSHYQSRQDKNCNNEPLFEIYKLKTYEFKWANETLFNSSLCKNWSFIWIVKRGKITSYFSGKSFRKDICKEQDSAAVSHTKVWDDMTARDPFNNKKKFNPSMDE